MKWILILLVHVGPLADGNSVTLTNVPGFASEDTCNKAGALASKQLVKGTVKASAFVCVPQ